jgi:hypothetical protein
MIHLVTFHTPDMSRAAALCASSALQHGADSVTAWTRAQLEATGFYRANRELLDEPRGSGYWSWKSFLVNEEIQRCSDGDFILYSDAGVEFIDNIRYITDRTNDVFLFGNNWQHAHWCKRNVIDAIMQGAEWSQFGKQAQSSVIAFRVSPYTRWFVEHWLNFCTIKHLIDDSPCEGNHPEFREHRHDQAILTTLAHRSGIPLHWWPARYNDAFDYPKGDYEDDYPVLVNHHRKRNGEFQ